MRTRHLLFAISISSVFMFSCMRDMSSEQIFYRGQLTMFDGSRIDTSIDIYITNFDYYLTPEYKNRMESIHPDSQGSFFEIELAYTHYSDIHVEHWQCGPLRILIEGDSIQTYFDSLSNDQLKTLKQNSVGEWILPTITLQKK